MFPSCDTHRLNLFNSKISKRKLKKEYPIFSGKGKNETFQTVSSILHLERQARYFTLLERHKIKLDKNKIDRKFIKSHQCSLLISCCILTEINPEFWPRSTRQKQILTGLLVKKISKNGTMRTSLFNFSMLGYISPITTSLPDIYRRNSCPIHIFQPTLRLDFKHHPTQEYFRQIYHYLGPL